MGLMRGAAQWGSLSHFVFVVFFSVCECVSLIKAASYSSESHVGFPHFPSLLRLVSGLPAKVLQFVRSRSMLRQCQGFGSAT